MFSFNIILTEICNANCSHCYMSNSSKKAKRTMSKKDINRILENMPKNTKTIVFTGGEIFLVKDLLLFAIKNAKKTLPNVIIGLESNGIYFYKDGTNAKKELIELSGLGVNFIRFSDDPFHAMGGVDLEKVRELKKLQDEVNMEIKYLVQSTAVPIGRAKKLENKYKEKKNCMNNYKSILNPYLFLDVNGNTFICTWKCIPSIGNMIRDSWDTILDNLNSSFNQFILSGKIEKAINSLENNKDKEKENIVYSKLNGQCMLCYKKFAKKGE